MFLATMAALTLGAVGGDLDPSALVARLGSPRYADRRGASDDLEKLGRRAVEALRAARSTDDAEVRSRAEMLLDKIETDLLTRPTMVTLDGRGRPLVEVVRDLAGHQDAAPPCRQDQHRGRAAEVIFRDPAGDQRLPQPRRPLQP